MSDELARVALRTGIEAEVDCVKFGSPLYCALRLAFPVGKDVAV